MKSKIKILSIVIFFTQFGHAQTISHLIGNERLGKKDSVANWTIHFQLTIVDQYHPAFHADTSGINSLNKNAENAASITTTVFLGRKLWKGAALYFNPELTGGMGLSKTTGIAGFPNGEIYRVGNPTPTPFVARAFFQQIIPLGHTGYDIQASDENRLSGKIPTSRIVISIGRFCLADFFDDNTYSHDARSQFLNWSLMASGSWDFPADTRGYTGGLVVELIRPLWAIRLSGVQVPAQANALQLDWHLNKANSETLEFTKEWEIKNQPGAIRAMGYITFSRAPYYKNAIQAIQSGDTSESNLLVSVISGRTEWDTFGGIKYGFGLNAEQEIVNGTGVFARVNWNDGHSATWAFTEIDENLQLGINMRGNWWKRPMDNLGIALSVNGLSPLHRQYLELGGYGFLIGDGSLNYGNEIILETFYKIQLASFLALSPDYQFIANPAYNKNRGPVNILGVRLHVEI